MTAVDHSPKPEGYARLLGWKRVRYPLGAAVLFGLLLSPGWRGPHVILFGRLLLIAFAATITFGILERWPARAPRWIARWVRQIIAVAVTIPIATWIAYAITTYTNPVPFWHDNEYLTGFATISVLGLLVAPWMAVSALIGQISGEAQRQALAFELERSELERKALDARMRLLQAQVEPHFLFNTLANVRELVESGSPQASSVLGSLIDYLRAAVPRLHDAATSLAQELQLVRAYLEVMRMRMPDRLEFALHVDAQAASLQCPPMSVLTLVENAVRHGIDPAENGGRIDVFARIDGGRCEIEVRDSGVGLQTSSNGLGTGLATLRERLQLVFGGDANLHVVAVEPHGVCARLDFPAKPITP